MFSENRKLFRLESKICSTGFTTPKTSNQIDAVVYVISSGVNQDKQVSSSESAVTQERINTLRYIYRQLNSDLEFFTTLYFSATCRLV